MSLSDPIGDMIARIKNSQARKHKSVKLPSSKFKIKIAEVLKDEGFIIDFKTDDEGSKTYLDIIAIPRPLLIFGRLLALEKILLPGLEILSIVFITGFPELYFKMISIEGFFSSFIL